jgi:SEC-C motif
MFSGATPREITNTIREFCSQLVSDPQPRFLPVTPAAGAKPRDCFPVVERYVQSHGGSSRYGWQIWEWPQVILEAEFHAVWEDHDGNLHDLTPKDLSTDRILFLPDPERVYQGRQVNNVRLALSPAPEVRRYIQAYNSEFEFLNRGARAEMHELRLSDAECRELRVIQQQKLLAETQLAEFLSLFPIQQNWRGAGKLGRNAPCPCGSGKKVKNCHRELV